MEESRKAKVLISIKARIDAFQNNIDEFDDALDNLEDSKSSKHIHISKGRQETADELKEFKLQTEQYE